MPLDNVDVDGYGCVGTCTSVSTVPAVNSVLGPPREPACRKGAGKLEFDRADVG